MIFIICGFAVSFNCSSSVLIYFSVSLKKCRMKGTVRLCMFMMIGWMGCGIPFELPEGMPTCMRQRMGQILSEAPWEPTARIYEVSYQNQRAYFIPAHCCDIPSELYTADCQVLCFPDGGLNGQGDGRCMDFEFREEEAKLIWQDKRVSKKKTIN
ncbi:MAG: hypothetical protein AAFR59_14705, partial [Bacteroidota bacterium]